ncbi:hypothetical protein Rhow_001102 [Rhodococcus wratislaviensis]|uniref:Uncharacterized protein n=1 Tax=Rhodococcus wratislaviensis TaxID=44752 RepID=A0A402CNG4_RHOWR|nr:hypothetical protein [Rhodococcus wratislaviensis]GCE45075.1 hypothetical protein Rhow_001102 [Rhodococcus wratislaviensis]
MQLKLLEVSHVRRPKIALTAAVLIAAAAAAGAVAVASSTSKPNTAEEYSVTNKDQPIDDQSEDIDDLEEPFISDEPPLTAEDYVRQSKPDSQTADDGPSQLSGPSVSGEGWQTPGQ